MIKDSVFTNRSLQILRHLTVGWFIYELVCVCVVYVTGACIWTVSTLPTNGAKTATSHIQTIFLIISSDLDQSSKASHFWIEPKKTNLRFPISLHRSTDPQIVARAASIVPVPSVSKRSKASLISAFCSLMQKIEMKKKEKSTRSSYRDSSNPICLIYVHLLWIGMGCLSFETSTGILDLLSIGLENHCLESSGTILAQFLHRCLWYIQALC